MKKILPIILITAIVVGVGAFYGGMKYQESKTPRGFAQGDFQNLRNLSPEERQQRIQQRGISGIGNQSGAGFTTGEIIAKDEKSITVKLRDGGSKIIFYSDSTEIDKFMSGITNDLEVGKTVIVSGKTNQDGSITATSIQLRPDNISNP